MQRVISIFSILFTPVFFINNSVLAQDIAIKRENFLSNYVFKGNHIQFDVMAMSVFKARIVNQSGSYPVSSKAALGLSIGFKYKINFSNTKSLVIGPDVTILGRTFITAFNKDDFSPPLIRNYRIKGINSYAPVAVISLPILFERRWLYAKTRHFFANAGGRFSFGAGADYESMSIIVQNVNNGFIDVGGTNVYANNDAKPWISFPLNAGHSWLLKNNNLLQLSICGDISFTKYVNGTYTVENVPNRVVTTGSYSSTGSYIGLSFSYVFTSANYRIRKAFEKMRKNK